MDFACFANLSLSGTWKVLEKLVYYRQWFPAESTILTKYIFKTRVQGANQRLKMLPLMLSRSSIHAVLSLWTVVVLSCSIFSGTAANSFEWNTARNRISVDIDGWQLGQLLQKITDSTDWQVFVEPKTQFTRPLSSRFKGLPIGEGFRRLFGDINFALLPQRNQPPTLYVFKTSVDDATQRIMPQKRDDDRIRNELVVRLKDGSEGDIDAMARQLGAKVTGRIDSLGVYRLLFGDDNAAQLARDGLTNSADVDLVESNYSIPRPAQAESVPISSIPSLNIRAGSVPDSSRVIVALIDTPVQANVPYNDFLLPEIKLAGEATLGTLVPTHGTSMFEIIMTGLSQSQEKNSVSPVRVLPIDVYGNSGSTSTFDVAKGIVTAVDQGASIVNLSLGSSATSTLMQNVIQQGSDKGVVFVAAAGNQPTTQPTYPAAYAQVIAVTAGTRSGDIAGYANYGSFVDAVAPGGSLVHYSGSSFYISGTSAAAAFISGTAAGISANTGAPAIQVRSAISDVFGVGRK